MMKSVILSLLFVAIAIAQSTSTRPPYTGPTLPPYTGATRPPPTGTRLPRPSGREGRQIRRDLLTDREMIVSTRKRTKDTSSFMRFIVRASRGLTPDWNDGLIVRMDGLYKIKGGVGAKLDNRIKFLGLQYYTENGVAGSGFQSTDTPTTYVDIGDVQWKPFNNPDICTNANGQWTCSVVSLDNSIGLNLYLQENDVSIQGINVNATSMKFDFWFNKLAGEPVALVAKMESRSVIRDRTDAQLTVTKQRGFGTDSDAGYFDFADNFFFDGNQATTYPVVVSQFVDENSSDAAERPRAKLITFSFISTDGGRVIWDPVVGANEADTSSAITITFSMIFLLIAIVFAL